VVLVWRGQGVVFVWGKRVLYMSTDCVVKVLVVVARLRVSHLPDVIPEKPKKHAARLMGMYTYVKYQ